MILSATAVRRHINSTWAELSDARTIGVDHACTG
jgi:hypothetical protein